MKRKTTYLGWVLALVSALVAPSASAAQPQLESSALSAAPFGSFISRTPLLDSAPKNKDLLIATCSNFTQYGVAPLGLAVGGRWLISRGRAPLDGPRLSELSANAAAGR